MANSVDIQSVRSFSSVRRCRPSNNLQACAILLLLVASLNAGVADGAAVGACGNQNGGFTCDSGYCCSKDSFCGPGDPYCGAGCQTTFSLPGACYGDTRPAGPAAPPGPTSEVCGRNAGNQKCQDNMCCSQFGHCGTSGEFCYKGCQSQCRFTPGQIAGIVFGALAGFAILCTIAFGIFKLYKAHQRKKVINRDSIVPVHRLFPVDTAEDRYTCLDIVFCHGFAIGDLEKDAWKNTWQTRRGDHRQPVVCWAKEWLGSDLEGKARVFALEYDANVSADPTRRGPHTDVSEIAKNLLHCLFGDSYKIGQSNAVVLIGHSFGGLVIKSLVVEAQRLVYQKAKNAFDRTHAGRCQKFVNNIQGFIFYAVPHSGAQNLDVYMRGVLRWYNKRAGGAHHDINSPNQGTLLSNIADLSRKMEELSVDFEDFLKANVNAGLDTRDHDDLPVFAFIEGLPMSAAVGKIVEDASAVRLSKHNHFKVEAANHFNVCRPQTRDEASYEKLLSVLRPIISAESSSLRKAHSTNLTTQHFEVDGSHDFEGDQGSRSLLREGKNLFTSQKLTRLTKSKPKDILPW